MLKSGHFIAIRHSKLRHTIECRALDPRLGHLAGSRVVLQVGTLGEIVDLTRERPAPFKVRFEGFPHTVVPRLEKLDILA
jgi:hypothetical protein